MVVSELRGEKIDIIPWNTDPARFVAKALSPARVREVFVDDETKEATVVVPDDQLALAIGKEGLNARLAARLSGWKVDIVSDTEFAQQEAEAAYGGGGDDEEFTGRCSAVLSNGKRCPNAALPGSKYCGVPAHQAARRWRSRTGGPAIVQAEEPTLEAPPTRPSPRGHRGRKRSSLAIRRTTCPCRGRGDARRVRGRSTGRQTRAQLTRTDQDVRGLRPQGAEARARALRGPGGALTQSERRPGTRRLHVPEALLFRARGYAARFQPNATPVGASTARAGAALH